MTPRTISTELQRLERDLVQVAFAFRASDEPKGALQDLAELLESALELVTLLDDEVTIAWQDTQFLALPLRTQRLELGLLSGED